MDRYRRNAITPRFHPFPLMLLLAGLFPSGLVSGATITVETNADVIVNNGDCSLREAIINANKNDQTGSTDCAGGEAAPGVTDEIIFDASTDNTSFVLTLNGASENAAETGDLDVTDSLIITGNGADSVTEIDGNATDRVFEVRNGARLQLFRLAVTNGGAVTAGGGINVFDGRLDMTDAGVLSNNLSGGPGFINLQGAGIRALDALKLTRVSILGNGIEGTGNASAFGGGIYIGTDASFVVTDSLIKGNIIDTVDNTAAGAAVFNHPANAAISSSITGSILSGNQANTSGEGGASGGGINHQAGALTLSRVLLSNNAARRTGSGGGSVASGGAMIAFAPVQIVNTTVSGNRSESVDTSFAGGMSLSGGGTVNNVTITNNRVIADTGEVASGGGLRGTGTLDVSNTIIAGNSSTNSSPDCGGSFTSAGYNLIGDNSSCSFTATTGDLVGNVAGGGSPIDPELATLGDYGGSISIDGLVLAMESNAPLTGSPAVDAGDPNVPGDGGTCQTTDQRGDSRPEDGDNDGGAVCDIGAIEDAVSGGSSSLNRAGGGGGGGALSFLFAGLAGLMLLRRRKPL